MIDAAEYLALDATALSALVRRADISAAEAVEAAISRAAVINPTLNALVHPQYAQARQTAAAPLTGGALEGVPLLLKDLTVAVAGWPLTNGSRMFSENVSSLTSELALRYVRAGAILFGRTTSPEFGLSTDTTSALHGATLNPWDPTLAAGGSSGGAAAVVAAGIVPVAQGGDGGGSIRIPAAFCGVFGLKPSRGRMPTGPVSAEGFAGMAVNHVLSRSVRDSASFLDISAGPDIGAPYTAPPPSRPYFIDAQRDPRKLRIGFQTQSFTGVEVDPLCVEAAKSAAVSCTQLGHSVEPTNITVDAEALGRVYATVLGTMIGVLLDDRAAVLGRRIEPADAEPLTLAMLERIRSSTSVDYARVLASAHSLARQFSRQISEFDVILTPTTAIPQLKSGVLSLRAPDLAQYEEYQRRVVAFTQIFNVAGLPAMSIPLFWSATGMPVGVQFGAGYGDESTLIQLAGQLERARPWAHHYARCWGSSPGRRSLQ